MPEEIAREIRLKSRPSGLPAPENFEIIQVPVPKPRDGEFLVRNLWMSVDPYMRGRMREGRSYAPPWQIGQPCEGGCVGRVVASKRPGFTEGDIVSGMKGWRDCWISDGSDVRKIDPTIAPIEAHLGVLGMPGMTAYVGLLHIAEMKEGETVFVSGAAGAVGSVVCQIAKIRNGRVIASAGSDEKIRWLREEAGVDRAFNYKTADSILGELRRFAPDGIDVYFENVGGDHLDAALRNMANFGRIAVCGMISRYNEEQAPPGPRSIHMLIASRIRMQGFLVRDHERLYEPFVADMSRWIAEGRVRWKETVVEGLENAPKAFIGLFHGENLGKMLVKIA